MPPRPEADLEPAQALERLLEALGGSHRLEIEILSRNRGLHRDFLFNLDAVLGYAKDERLIEYKILDTFGPNAGKMILVYPYGENADTPDIIRRRPGDPAGDWKRYFRSAPRNRLSLPGKSE